MSTSPFVHHQYVYTAYTYDAWSNRASMTGNGTSSTYTYDANNRLTQSITEQGTTTTTADYYYDHNGNQITKAVSITAPQSGVAAYFMSPDTNSYLSLYQYDSYNRLKSADTDGTVTSYTYYGNNLRQSKTSNGITTQHIWDGSDMVMDGTNKFYRGATGIEFAVLNGNTSFYHKDAHGDVTALTDNIGTITQSYIYDAFGNQLNENENDINPFRYCGEYLDSETGLTYLRNRYYDNARGRFITEDPIKDGLNWYVYCENNPVMYVDPFGLFYIKYNSNGVYSVHKDRWGFLATRNLVGAFTGGDLIVAGVETMAGVVGGRSATTVGSIFISNAMDDISDMAEKSGKKLFKNAAKTASKIYTAYEFLEQCDTVYMDQIAFNLIERNNISTQSGSIDSLETLMINAYSFILDNEEYFSVKCDGQSTMFEIDNKIAGSKNPEKTINQLVVRFELFLNNARTNGFFIPWEKYEAARTSYRSILNAYEDRMIKVDADFSNAVK